MRLRCLYFAALLAMGECGTLCAPAQAQRDVSSGIGAASLAQSPAAPPIEARPAAATVRVPIELTSNGSSQGSHSERRASSESQVVVWLTAQPGTADAQSSAPTPGHFRLEQNDKSFQPHLLVIPLGSTVEFPNHDPFFHNVFSQYNGKRFDLGLYEAGTNRSVLFNHEGVSYIFCNIHSQMAAVIIAVGTRFSTVLEGPGTAEFRNVPAGDYIIHVWREGVEPAHLTQLARPIHVTDTAVESSPIRIAMPTPPAPHKNKFGEDYLPDIASPYPH